MTEPRPLNPDAASALALYGRQTAAPLSPNARARALAGAVQSAQAPAHPLLVAVPIFGVAALVGAAAYLLLVPAQPAGPLARAPVASGAPAPVMLARGKVRHAIGAQRQVFQSSELEVAAQRAVVLFDVTEAGTSVSVESGTAEVRPASGAARTLAAGESLWVPSAGAASLEPLASAGEVEGCTAPKESSAWRSCLATQSLGAGLVAETALFELSLDAQARGDFARAEESLRAYQRRFADGAFAPEVSIALMRGLRASGATEAARAEARNYLGRFAGEPRAADVRRFLEQLK